MIVGLDHIAIAVPEIEKAIQRFKDDFGLSFDGTEDVENAKTSTAFFPVPATQIELVHPLRGEGPIAKYLEKKGGGLHHISLRTDDILADGSAEGQGLCILSASPPTAPTVPR